MVLVPILLRSVASGVGSSVSLTCGHERCDRANNHKVGKACGLCELVSKLLEMQRKNCPTVLKILLCTIRRFSGKKRMPMLCHWPWCWLDSFLSVFLQCSLLHGQAHICKCRLRPSAKHGTLVLNKVAVFDSKVCTVLILSQHFRRTTY